MKADIALAHRQLKETDEGRAETSASFDPSQTVVAVGKFLLDVLQRG